MAATFAFGAARRGAAAEMALPRSALRCGRACIDRTACRIVFSHSQASRSATILNVIFDGKLGSCSLSTRTTVRATAAVCILID